MIDKLVELGDQDRVMIPLELLGRQVRPLVDLAAVEAA
jgi:hypothetical protein